MTDVRQFIGSFTAYRIGSTPSDPQTRKEADGAIFRYIGPSKALHDSTILSPGLKGTRAELESTVQKQIDYFRDLNRSFEWKIYDFDDADVLIEVLTAKGFTPDHSGTVMFAPVSLEVPPRHDSPNVTRITSVDDFTLLAAVQNQVWDRDASDFVRGLHAESSHTQGRVDVFLAALGSEPVACAWVRHYGEISFFFGGSTIAKARGLGAYTELVRSRIEAARARGARFVVSECVPASERILRHLGFTKAGRVTKYNFIVNMAPLPPGPIRR